MNELLELLVEIKQQESKNYDQKIISETRVKLLREYWMDYGNECETHTFELGQTIGEFEFRAVDSFNEYSTLARLTYQELEDYIITRSEEDLSCYECESVHDLQVEDMLHEYDQETLRLLKELR